MAEPRKKSGLLEIHVDYVFDRLFESKPSLNSMQHCAATALCWGIAAMMRIRKFERVSGAVRSHRRTLR